MARGREDRHWKTARPDLCGSAAESIRIFPTPRPVVLETNRANRATQPDPKGFLSSLRFHHERLKTLSILDRNGGPQTADLDLFTKKIIRPSLPSRVRSTVLARPSIPSETGERDRSRIRLRSSSLAALR